MMFFLYFLWHCQGKNRLHNTVYLDLTAKIKSNHSYLYFRKIDLCVCVCVCVWNGYKSGQSIMYYVFFRKCFQMYFKKKYLSQGKYTCCFFFFLSSTEAIFFPIAFRERGRQRGREGNIHVREKHWSPICTHTGDHTPHTGNCRHLDHTWSRNNPAT